MTKSALLHILTGTENHLFITEREDLIIETCLTIINNGNVVEDSEAAKKSGVALPELEEQPFYDLMQVYRCAPTTEQDRVLLAFKEVKDYVRQLSQPAQILYQLIIALRLNFQNKGQAKKTATGITHTKEGIESHSRNFPSSTSLGNTDWKPLAPGKQWFNYGSDGARTTAKAMSILCGCGISSIDIKLGPNNQIYYLHTEDLWQQLRIMPQQ